MGSVGATSPLGRIKGMIYTRLSTAQWLGIASVLHTKVIRVGI